MRVHTIDVREVLDSRGLPTVEIEMRGISGETARAQIPTGESKGAREAAAVPVARAARSAKTIATRAQHRIIASVAEFDNALIALDGTEDKSRLGGNVMLGASVCFARLLAQEKRMPLWELLRSEFFPRETGAVPPKIFANVIEGGVHTTNNLAFQEYLVIADAKRGVRQAAHAILTAYTALKKDIAAHHKLGVVPIGDEDGVSVDFKNSEEPLAFLERIIKRERLQHVLRIGVDAAASTFYRARQSRPGTYRVDDKDYSRETLMGYYLKLHEAHPALASLEDPFDETDFATFSELHQALGDEVLVIGDDLTVTNPGFVRTARNLDAISGIIVKPNQVGTLTETALTIQQAKRFGVKPVLSHRARETEDTFIIDIARAANAYGVKIGVPVKERVIKYNQLLRIYPS